MTATTDREVVELIFLAVQVVRQAHVVKKEEIAGR
jgi:hypothetical protein